MPQTAERPWAAGPTRPLLATAAVHVWRADLAECGDDLWQLLCGEERARAERFRCERDGRLWARSRGVLRALLGRYLHIDARSLRFQTGTHGKPALSGDRVQMRFNLSHSRHLALYAFAQAGEVGVDIQLSRRGAARGAIGDAALAVRAFGPIQAQRLDGLSQTAREREFLRLWTRREAALKCAGTGLAGGGANAAERELWIAELDVGAGAAGAVAIEQPPRELRSWEWLL